MAYQRRTEVTVTQTLIGVNLLMALVVLFRGGFENPLTLVAVGADVPALVRAGEYWRWLSSTFIHGDLIHLLFNIMALYQLGRLVEYMYGPRKMLIIYVLSGLAGSVATFFFMRDAMMSVGASGAVFGLSGAALGMGARHRDQLNPQFKQWLTSGLIPLILFNFAFGLASPRINNWAHGGGFVAGFALGYLLFPDLAYARIRVSKGTWAMVGVVGVMLAYTAFFALPSAFDPARGFATQPMRPVDLPRIGARTMVPAAWVWQPTASGGLYALWPAGGVQYSVEDILGAEPGDPDVRPSDIQAALKQIVETSSGGQKPVIENIEGGQRVRLSRLLNVGGQRERVQTLLVWKGNRLLRFQVSYDADDDYFYRRLAERLLRGVVVQ